jgi:spermidine synthase
VEARDVRAVMREREGAFDAILLDIDNGPNAMTHGENAQLYGGEGIRQAMGALRKDGVLAIWSVTVDPAFEKRLRRAELAVRRFRVRAYKASKSRSRCVWVASRMQKMLPTRDERAAV